MSHQTCMSISDTTEAQEEVERVMRSPLGRLFGPSSLQSFHGVLGKALYPRGLAPMCVNNQCLFWRPQFQQASQGSWSHTCSWPPPVWMNNGLSVSASGTFKSVLYSKSVPQCPESDIVVCICNVLHFCKRLYYLPSSFETTIAQILAPCWYKTCIHKIRPGVMSAHTFCLCRHLVSYLKWACSCWSDVHLDLWPYDYL